SPRARDSAWVRWKCQPGYYKDGSSPFLALCVACECNGLSDECEDRTGRCLNCRYNTAGDRCERCKEGYYGDAALRTCRACPCPFTTSTKNFAVGCREVYGNIECICRTGYAGSRCERCAPGYYGDPLIPRGSCRPCNCAGNGNSCDPRTGGKFVEPNFKKKKSYILIMSGLIFKYVVFNGFIFSQFARMRWSQETQPQMNNQCDENEAAADQIRGLLEGYEAKLKELDKALKDAADLVKNANAQNGLNAKTLGDLQVMNKRGEYEQLAAQLDGAKTDLTKKVNEISKAAAKKDIVEAAEDHAKNLEKIAKDIEEYNASGRTEVRNAKHAIEAYKNITDAINAAEAAAKEAKVAAESTLNNVTNQKLTEKAKELKSHSKELLTEAEQAEKDLNGIQKCLLFFSLTFLVFPVNNLLNTIPSLTNKISTVENLTSQVSPISNISENIKMLKDLIEQARDAANKVTVPINFQGNGHVELHPPKNLDDLKAYTAISLMLQRPSGRGDGKRRRRQATEDNMFVLYLGNRDSTKNYIGMFLRNNDLYGVYNLNGDTYEIKTGTITRSGLEPATFDRVDLRRIYRDAEMILTKAITSNKESPPPIKDNTRGQESKDLLDVSPDDIVFYVGGYPANFTVRTSFRYPNYKGCIEFFSLNDRAVSLYNFKRKDNINEGSPCKRYVKPLDSDYYEGTGFGRVLVDNTATTFSITMSVNTRSQNGLLLYIGSEVNSTEDWVDIQVFVTTKKQFMVRVGGNEAAKAQADFDTQNIKDVYIGGAPQHLRERHNITIQPFRGCLKNLKLNKGFKPLDEKVGIIKGCPVESIRMVIDDEDKGQEERRDHFIPDTSGSLGLGNENFKGCISNLYTRRLINVKCTCLSLPIQKQYLFLFLVLHRPHFSLEVRTRSHEGMLFFAATRGGQSHLALYMSKGRIRLSVGKQKIFNREKYNDGKWHTVMFSLEKKKFRLVVDGIRAQDGQLTNAELSSMKQQFLSPVYLGSTPHSLHKELKHSVSGCVRNFKMNGAQMSNPTANHGSGPCFEGQTQRGAYFSGNGAHVVVNDSFVVGSSFELLFNIRPRSLTGLLLHVGVYSKTPNGLPMGHYLIIYMLGGEVRPHICLSFPYSFFFKLPVTSSFVGCIQDMGINGELVSFERPSSVFGPVNLKECPG
uniref:Si:ch211-241e1.3 n=1 Tax=Haplochromis burtoni TaxID=8153 RepID=A0A3Q2V7I8_HAPBU